MSTIEQEIKDLNKLPDDLQQKVNKLTDDMATDVFLFHEGKMPYEEYLEKRNKNYTEIERLKASYDNPNVAKIEQLRAKKYELYRNLATLHREAHYNAVAKYSDISDMCEAMGYKAFAGGHGRKYWNNRINPATECFAEIQSAMGTNKESLELLQKYIPNTIKIYKEIIGEIHNGKK